MQLAEKRDGRRFLTQKRGILFFVIVFFLTMQAGLLASHRDNSDSKDGPERWLPQKSGITSFSGARSGQKKVITQHPIPQLIADAEANFRNLLSSQSRTLKAAVAEYKKRYKRNPPKGFDLWWKFVQDNDVKMVDEYDGLVNDLAPFWEISGLELRRRAVQAGSLPHMDLVRIQTGKAVAVNLAEVGVSSRAVGFRRMIEKFQHTLPNMDFPINVRSEGRVLVPWEHRKYPNMTLQDSSAGLRSMVGQIHPDWQHDGNVWEAYRLTCAPSSPSRRLLGSIRSTLANQITMYFPSFSGAGHDFNFVKTTDGKTDFCRKPWARYTQGHFFSDWRTIPVLYPVFSPAKAPGFSDIKIPSHYYYGSTPRYTYGWDAVNLELKEVDEMEVPWENKYDKIFWRGATTGGGSHPPGHVAQYHRHRFLRMAGGMTSVNRTITFADPPDSNRFVMAEVPVNSLNADIMDTAFVKAVGPYPGGFYAMKEDLRFGDAFSLGSHWTYKYLLDLDGQSYSGRFMAFMASDSAVVKSTVYQEYFSDWIQPWLHFIPLSSSYKEIYNIHAFFSGATPSTLEAANSTTLHESASRRRQLMGDRRLRRIARAGKQWKKTIGRTIDMEAYVYRLCLEYARLWADDRGSMDFRL